ncbi:MAG: VWA domain-containing protein [Desulfurococcales archaeon]|nr:VWA domain-containing protein [Desulfurococcales archaeon]
MPAIVYAVDVSISMARSHGDFLPHKLAASLSALAISAKRILSRRGKIGLVLFAGFASPVVPLTTEYDVLARALGIITRTYEGSAPGDAIVESVKLLRRTYTSEKKIVVISDGEFNTGTPIEHASLYARNMGVWVHYVTIGALQQVKIKNILLELTERKLLEWNHANSKNSLISILMNILKD